MTVKPYQALLNERKEDTKNILELKQRTIMDDNIEFIDGNYRYVNHADKLATTGFSNKRVLLKNSDIIRFDSSTILLMRNRYDSIITGKDF